MNLQLLDTVLQMIMAAVFGGLTGYCSARFVAIRLQRLSAGLNSDFFKSDDYVELSSVFCAVAGLVVPVLFVAEYGLSVCLIAAIACAFLCPVSILLFLVLLCFVCEQLERLFTWLNEIIDSTDKR